MDELLRTLGTADPALVFVALPDVDRTSHLFGPDSPQAHRALAAADGQVARFVAFLRERGSWDRTVLMITADHGFTSVEPNVAEEAAPYPVILFGRELQREHLTGVTAVSDGLIETLALPGDAPTALVGDTASMLARVRALALAQPEIAEAWYRIPNPADGGDATTLATVHPDWRMDNPRLGEIVLVAKPHHQFVDPFSTRLASFVGMHGGPDTARIPVILTGGWPRLRTREVTEADGVAPAANPDLGVTAAWLLGVRAPRLIHGAPVPLLLAGRVLREAFTDD